MRRIVVAALLAAAANPVQAAVFEYRYTGSPLRTEDPYQLVPGFDEFLPFTYHGRVLIDEAALPGGTLVNATVNFSIYEEPPGGVTGMLDGLMEFDISNFPWPGVAGSFLEIVTDADRRIVAWRGEFLDGPPDGGIRTTGDYFYVPSDPDLFYASVSPGVWSAPTVVPAPAGLLLAATYLAGLAALRSRRRVPCAARRG